MAKTSDRERARAWVKLAREKARSAVLPFVTLYAHLPPEQYRIKVLDAVIAIGQRFEAGERAEAHEAEKVAWLAILEQSAWREYHRLRMAGAPTGGNA